MAHPPFCGEGVERPLRGCVMDTVKGSGFFLIFSFEIRQTPSSGGFIVSSFNMGTSGRVQLDALLRLLRTINRALAYCFEHTAHIVKLFIFIFP